MTSPAPVLLPSLLDLCPQLRPRVDAAALEIHRLVAAVVAVFPDAAVLALEPLAAEYLDSTPYDHAAADLIAAAHALTEIFAALHDPV